MTIGDLIKQHLEDVKDKPTEQPKPLTRLAPGTQFMPKRVQGCPMGQYDAENPDLECWCFYCWSMQ